MWPHIGHNKDTKDTRTQKEDTKQFYGYIRIDIPRKLFYRLNIERNTCSVIIICDGVRLFIEIDTKDKVYIDPNNSNRCVFCGGFAQTFQNGIWICNRCLKDEKLNTLNTLMDIK